MLLGRKKRRRAPRELPPITLGPFRGMRDSRDPGTFDPTLAFLIRNGYPLLSDVGGGIAMRPGYTRMGQQLPGKVQIVFQFTMLNGTEHTLAISAGRFYRFNWTTGQWVEYISPATFSTATISISTSARIYAVIIADQVVFSDGVNLPWMWDGTGTGAGTLTKLTNAAVMYGQPTVHYAKLFGIKAAERNTIIWSEENQPNTGYESGFDNAWALVQTDQEALYAIRGTNAALYYWRANGIGAIAGSVNDDYRTTGVQDAVSQTIGTRSPGAVVLFDRFIYFLDQRLRPQLLQLGGGIATSPAIWFDAQNTIGDELTTPLAAAETATGVFDPRTQMVVLGMQSANGSPSATGTANNLGLVYEATAGQFAATWNFLTAFEALATITDDMGVRRLVHADASGYVYLHGSPQGLLWTDVDTAGTATIVPLIVEGAHAEYDARYLKHFGRLDTTFRAAGGPVEVGVSHATPRSAAYSSEIAQVVEFTSFERKATFGLSVEGRWLRPRVKLTPTAVPASGVVFDIMALHATVAGDYPQAR